MPSPHRAPAACRVHAVCRDTLPIYVLLAALVFTAHFLHAYSFGIYEDDWNRIPYTAGISVRELCSILHRAFTGDLSQGRPLHPFFIDLFSYAGFKTGSLLGLYAIAFGIETVNVLLFHALLVRVFKDFDFALLGALAFCVFPADTTQPFLTHAYGVQTAICFLLLALLLHVSDWHVASYLAILAVLFTYETPYLVFAAAPLLKPSAKRERWTHWAVMASLLVLAFAVRRWTGEQRIVHLTLSQLFGGASNIITGPLTSVTMYLYRPMEALFKLRGWDWTVTLAAVVSFGWLLTVSFGGSGRIQYATDPYANVRSDLPDPLRLGVLMLLLAYPLTLTTAGISVAGRGTRVHIAAALGCSILFAWVCQQALTHVVSRRRMVVRRWGVACLFGLLTGFGLVVQRDYALSWQEQRCFWTSLVRLAPPLHDGDVIFVEPTGLRDTRQLLFLRKDLTGIPDTRQIKSLDTLLTGLQALYRMPPSWTHPPQVFRLPLGWQQQIVDDGERLRLLTIEAPEAFNPSSREPVRPEQVIFLETKHSRLSRMNTFIDVRKGRILNLNSAPGPIWNMPKRAFFRYVTFLDGTAVHQHRDP